MDKNKQITLSFMADRSYFISEAFKSLRTNILFCGSDIRCIAVTSVLPGDGKSTVSLDIAKSFSDTGKNVLFVDADMRKSVNAVRHKISGSFPGLSEFLSGQACFTDIITETQTPFLNMVVSGMFPPDPVELLGNNRFSEFIDKCRRIYDYIIIDTPPLGAVIDAAVVAPRCDGVIVVIPEGKISSKLAVSVKNQLEKSNCRILGAVMNFAKSGNDSYKHYYSSKNP